MIDFFKPMQTKDGVKARLLTIINKARQPAVVVITYEDGEEDVSVYTADGHFFADRRECKQDLVNV